MPKLFMPAVWLRGSPALLTSTALLLVIQIDFYFKHIYYAFKFSEKPVMNTLSAVLSHLMSQAGIKSAELARKTGIGQPVIYRLMTGATDNPQLLTLKPIADHFGITLDQLAGYAPLTTQKVSHRLIHDLNNKLSTIRTITSVLIDFIPTLIEGYKKCIAANLMEERISSDVLPLLELNINNLLKVTNQIQELFS